MARTPERGDVFWAENVGAIGVEQQGLRPAVVIQNNRGNRSSPSTVVAIMSSAPLPRIYPFTVTFSAGEGGSNRNGYVNCSQIFTVDRTRLQGYMGRFDAEFMSRVDAALRYEFDL